MSLLSVMINLDNKYKANVYLTYYEANFEKGTVLAWLLYYLWHTSTTRYFGKKLFIILLLHNSQKCSWSRRVVGYAKINLELNEDLFISWQEFFVYIRSYLMYGTTYHWIMEI